MERLKPILKQKFWILLGIAIMMTLAGWWSATAGMLQQIKSRREIIETAFKDVPKDKIPQETWATSLGTVNDLQKKSITATRALLWQQQLAKFMEWPKEIQPRSYRGPFSDGNKEAFRYGLYEEEVKKVWKELRPFEPDGTGIVNYPIEDMYALLGREPEWKGAIIGDKEMWDIKEDLLLLETLFQSIAAVNGGDQDTLRSVDMIHQINDLQLRGGGPKPKAVAAATASAAPAGGNVSAGRGADLPFVNPDFNATDEFGEDNSGMARSAAPAPGSKPDPKAQASKPVERYINKGENDGPFKTRGFYLSVLMDHQKIPQLLAELTANDRSKFPVEVVRVQMSRVHEDLSPSTGSDALKRKSRSVAGPTTTTFKDMEEEVGRGGRRRGDRPARETVEAPRNDARKTPAGEQSSQQQAAIASLNKALNNPAIALVTICGVFTLYQPVDLQAVPATQPKPSATPAAVAPAHKEETKPAATDESEKTPDQPVAAGDSESTKGADSKETAMAEDQANETPKDDNKSRDKDSGTEGDAGAGTAKKKPDEK